MNRVKNRKTIESFLLIGMIVAASLAILLPLTAPKVSAQVTHLGSTSAEDTAGAPYDMGPSGDFIVQWDAAETHIMNVSYIVETGWELRIPALNHAAGREITVTMPINITVMAGAKLTFGNDGPFTKTRILYTGAQAWQGIYFAPDSEGSIVDVEIYGAITAITFSPGSFISNGIAFTRVEDFNEYGIYIDGAVGDTSLFNVDVIDSLHSGTGMYVSNCVLTLTDVILAGHANFKSSLHINNAYVTATNGYYNAEHVPGNAIVVENSPAPNSTVVTNPYFANGAPDSYYVKCDGGSPLIIGGTYEEANNARAVQANTNGMTMQASHATLLNPGDGSPFNSTRVNASLFGSKVTIQWYVDVFVDDPYGNAVPNSLVDLEAPSWPDTMFTDAGGDLGWARGFVVTEKVVYYSTIDNYNPLNASAENNTMIGYADPEPDINISSDVFITVPFNPTPNTPPTATILTTLSGVYSGLISIDYTVTDPDPGDDGSLSVQVLYWDDSLGWAKAEADVSSDPITGLTSGVTYTFVWDSRHTQNLLNKYSSNVQIRIIPYDKYVSGTFGESGIFTVDNKWPVVLTGPTATPTDTSCVIQWTLNEASTAEVWFGIYGDGTINDMTTEVADPLFSTSKSINLPNLLPGRRYTFVINSTDDVGNKNTSAPVVFFFETTLSIQLYTGWNMISIPHYILEPPLHIVLATIAGDWDIAMWYDASDPGDPWKTNYTGKPYHMNDLSEYFPFMALWIHCTTDTVLTPNYSFDELFPGQPLELRKGWNFRGYNSVTPRNIDDALSSIAGSWDKVEHYDAATGEWLINDGPLGYIDTLTTMEPKKGYWIHTTQVVNWSLPYR